MRWRRVALCLLCLALVAGCGGGEETGSADLPDALEELHREAGAQFDPAVVEAWCAVYARRALTAAA